MRLLSLVNMVAILTLLLIATPSFNFALAGSQQELSIPSVGKIVAQDDFAATIFFEYGAESGVLQPPWDHVGPVGSGDTSGSYTIVDNTHARTGTKSMRLYQVPPPKSDAQRRISNRYYQQSSKEFYVSWWVYFDNLWQTTGWHSTLGGWQIFFGPSSNRWYWWTGGRFLISTNARLVVFGYGWGKIEGGVDFSSSANAIEQTWDSSFYITDHLNEWVHFQVYVKFKTDNTGEIRAWVNDILIAEKTGIKTDPSGYSEWSNNPVDGGQCVWMKSEYPMVVIEEYQSLNSHEAWLWVDDVVAATKKVPESYRVVD